ncbi:MAG: phage portal protein [Chloroflexi bacterium]|nr:phage portal protein [Chloroflexota bacterium]
MTAVPGPGLRSGARTGNGVPLPQQLALRDADRLRRYREYLDYHEGRRGAPPSLRRGRERMLVFNYARAIVEKGAAYLVTEHRPVVTSAPSEAVRDEAERLLRATWEANDLARLDVETEVDAAVLGDGAYKVTWDDEEQRAVVSAPDVQGIFAWWAGNDVRRLRRVASRYSVDGVETVESWTADEFELWAGGERVERRANPYGAIPYVIYPNIPRPKQFWGMSDIEPLREPLEELNRAFTQLSRILELSGNPIAVLENVEEVRDIAVQPGAVWEVPERARAYLLDLLQGGGVRLHVEYVDLVYRALHDLSEVPRIAFGDGNREQSGIALQVELDPLLRRVARKRLIRTAAMRRRDRLILAVAGHHLGHPYEGVETIVEWEPVVTDGYPHAAQPRIGPPISGEASS